jgi:hypothetical protein
MKFGAAVLGPYTWQSQLPTQPFHVYRLPAAQNFKSQMEPVLEHYRGIGKVTTIRTDRPIPEVYAEVSGIWRKRFANATA